MKKSIYTLLISCAFITGTTLLTSCGAGTTNESESSEQDNMEEGHDHEKMASANYACPMHPEVTGKEGDKCSKCGMFLTKSDSNADEMKEHAHDMDTVTFSCPMHPDEKGLKGAKCAKCNMDLVASTNEMLMKSCNHEDGKTCGMCSTEGAKCDHKVGEKCKMCSKKEGMKCSHKEGETCSNCKTA